MESPYSNRSLNETSYRIAYGACNLRAFKQAVRMRMQLPKSKDIRIQAISNRRGPSRRRAMGSRCHRQQWVCMDGAGVSSLDRKKIVMVSVMNPCETRYSTRAKVIATACSVIRRVDALNGGFLAQASTIVQ